MSNSAAMVALTATVLTARAGPGRRNPIAMNATATASQPRPKGVPGAQKIHGSHEHPEQQHHALQKKSELSAMKTR
jgi:hypothetical protein